MKKFLILLALCATSFAATPITVTGVSQSGNTGGLKGNSFTRFRLRNFAGFVPRVVGTSIIVQTQFDVRPSDSLGNFTTPIYSNDDIVPNTCDPGGVTACTWWTVEYWNDGKISFSGNYCIPNTAPTYDLTMATPCQTPPLPAAPAQPFGTVTSVGFTGDGVVYNSVVPGSPITTFGTFAPTLHTHTANTIFAGPTSGGAGIPTFRTLVSADVSGLYSGTSPIDVTGTVISCSACGTSFPLLAPDGTAAAPSYSWSSASNTGWHFISPFTLTLSRNGVDQMSLNGDVHLAFGNQYCFSTMPSGACEEGWIRTNANVMGLQPSSAELRVGYISQQVGHLDQFDLTPTYSFMAHEVAGTPTAPLSTGFELAYFKAGKGLCSEDTAAVEYCPATIKVLSSAGPYTCSGDQNVCAFTLTWPSAWPDTNYTAVCDPVGPTNVSGSQSINNGGHGNLTTTTIDVYMTVNGSSSQSYASWTCHGIHN